MDCTCRSSGARSVERDLEPDLALDPQWRLGVAARVVNWMVARPDAARGTARRRRLGDRSLRRLATRETRASRSSTTRPGKSRSAYSTRKLIRFELRPATDTLTSIGPEVSAGTWTVAIVSVYETRLPGVVPNVTVPMCMHASGSTSFPSARGRWHR